MHATDFDSMTGFMQTQPEDGIYDDGRDERLDKALSLLNERAHRQRNGLVSLAILVALACSGVLLATIITGDKPTAEKPRAIAEAAVAPAAIVPPASESAAFELSGTPMPAASEAATPTPAIKEAVIIGTER